MEYKIVKSLEIEILNEFVYNHPMANIHQTGHIAEVHKRTKNCESLSLLVVDKNNNIIGSLLAINFSVKSGILKSYSTHTTIRGGPIVEDSNEGANICKYLLKEYKKNRKRTLYTRIYPVKQNNSVNKALEINNYNYEGYLNFLINLDRSQNEIWADIHKGRRKNINRAQKRFSLQISDLKERDEIPLFYELLEETHRHAAVPLEDISLFYATYDLLVPKKLARFIFAKKDGKAIACRLILTYKDEIYDWYAGAYRESVSCYPNDFLVWHVLCWGAEHGYKIFDFGGAGKPDEESSVRTFKERFGGKLINYGRFTKVHSQLKLKVAIKAYQTLRKMKKKKNEVTNKY